MQGSLIVIGMGQLGALLSEGLEATGVRVIGLRRGDDITAACAQHDQALGVLVAVGEDDLREVLSQIPAPLSARVLLLQNELRPDQWNDLLPTDPAVLVVWFERKGGAAPTPLLSTPIFPAQNPNAAEALCQAMKHHDLPAHMISTQDELSFELAVKNLYILGLNLTGLKVGGVAGHLLDEHRDIFRRVLDELLALESALGERIGRPTLLDRKDELFAAVDRAIAADPNHGCRGRSAPRRLERTLAHADSLDIPCPTLRSLGASSPSGSA